MILEVTGDQVAQLTDTELRMLVGYLCELEVRKLGHSPSTVTWGGHQNASDGGVDVRVGLPTGTVISGYVPKATTAFQVKAQKMPRGEILKEMTPDGAVLSSIAELANDGGAYIIVSSHESLSDRSLKNRKGAMAEAVEGLPSSSSLTLDFYDRRRIATWVNQHPGLVPWVRERLGVPLSGWRPFEDWSSSPSSLAAPYLLDDRVRLFGPSITKVAGLNAEQALEMLRGLLAKPKGVVRLVGLSGVGKTRLVQALFDDRIGNGALPWSDALYTDISDDPDPLPQEMLARLISLGHRVILIIDNCGIALHRKLAAKIAGTNCLLSVITVEYDIDDDEPQDTDIFKLEPASPDLIERILEDRYQGISPPSRHVIARFAEGNSRVAFALAETARRGESLAQLKDTDLFERLFHQNKTSSAELLDVAKTCALVYSFDGETLEGSESELAPLALLAGQSVDAVHRNVAELQRRQLVQKRGKWRAILPHALANRLAKRALEDIPMRRIEAAIVEGSSGRMLRSFSRRIGYLHEDEHAITLVAKWLAAGGLLEKLGKLNTLAEEIFVNVAPVNPASTLSFIERAAKGNEDWFFGEQNENKAQIVRIIRSLAFEPTLFERCVTLLQRFALAEAPDSRGSILDQLKSLFWLYLSGTHATADQRVVLVKSLLDSGVAAEQELGLTLLGEMLRTAHFSSHHAFEFGAWKRDFGFHPASGDQVRHWYALVIELACSAGASASGLSARVRRVVANNVSELLRTGMLDEVTELATSFAEQSGWPEGWIGVRQAIRRSKEGVSEIALKRLEQLEQRLRPSDLAGMIRSHALSPEWSALDVADLDEDEDHSPVGARLKVYDVCNDLGQQLAADPNQFDALLPEVVASESQKTFSLGRGLATGCDGVAECWGRLRDAFLQLPQSRRQAQLLAGFLASAVERAADESEILLDEILADPRLHPYLLYFQANAGINSKAFERMMKALAHDTVPASSFGVLALGRAHEKLSDEQLRQILLGILAKAGGNGVAAQILGMRVYGRLSDKLPITESMKATCREFLGKIELKRDIRLDHLLGQVIEVAFDKQDFEDQARALCGRMLSEIRTWNVDAWDLRESIAALAKTCPIAVLDTLVEQAAERKGAGRTVFHEMGIERNYPLDQIADDVWMAWAAKRPVARYELLARVLRFASLGGEDQPSGWSAAAMKLIDVAPEPEKVLDTFLKRFTPRGWSGSLADTLATRMPLIEALKHHSKPGVSAWASENMPAFAAQIDREREREDSENRARGQTFE